MFIINILSTVVALYFKYYRQCILNPHLGLSTAAIEPDHSHTIHRRSNCRGLQSVNLPTAHVGINWNLWGAIKTAEQV